MSILAGMATQAHDTPTFSRIISKGRPTSWTFGIPITIVVVALLALFAYFASKSSSYASELEATRLQMTQQQQGLTAAQQRLTTLESDLALARNPGLTTVTLQPSKDSNGAWASAVWGEMAGKGFLEVRAYGLKPAGEGKAYQAWFQAGEEKPVLVGVLDPGPNGAGFAMGKELPAAAKGGRVFVNLAAESAKTVEGTPLLEAKLNLPGKGDAAPAEAK